MVPKWQNNPYQMANTFYICKWIIFAISSFAIIDEMTIEAFSFSLPLFSKMATRQPAFKLLGLSSMLRNFSSFRHKKAMM